MANWAVAAKWTKQANGLAWDVLASFRRNGIVIAIDVPFKGIRSKENARRIFENQIAQYEEADFSPADGAFDMAVPAQTASPAPTAKELAERDYQQKRNALLLAKQDFDAKLIDQAALDLALSVAKDAKAALDALG